MRTWGNEDRRAPASRGSRTRAAPIDLEADARAARASFREAVGARRILHLLRRLELAGLL
jgi:hypothetical protein